jgi:bacteriocin leader peptide (microcyclamide/patellamide family)
MDKKNLMPIAAQPVNRRTTGQLPDVLAQLLEEALQQLGNDSANAAVFASADEWPDHVFSLENGDDWFYFEDNYTGAS